MYRRSSIDTRLRIPVSRQISKGLETTGVRGNREAIGVSSGTIPLIETEGLNLIVGMHFFSSLVAPEIFHSTSTSTYKSIHPFEEVMSRFFGFTQFTLD